MNMMSKYIRGLFVLMILLLTSCVPRGTSIIVFSDYDEKANRTDFTVFPYGEIGIPGKWEKAGYNQKSGQQLFENADSVSLAISFAPCSKYDFGTGRTGTGFEFVKAYYEWDSEYFVSQYGMKRNIIEQDSRNNFIIWHLEGLFEGTQVDNYFLFGEKKSYVSSFLILTTDKWTEKEKIIFLKNLFLN